MANYLFRESPDIKCLKSLILFIYFLCLFIDLGGAIFIRYVSILILLGVLVAMFFVEQKKFIAYFANPIVLFLFLIWPISSFVLGMFSGADPGLALQNILALLIFPLLILFFLNFEINSVIKAFLLAAIVFSGFVVVFWILLYAGNNAALIASDFLSEREAGYFGIRGISGVNFPVVYFKSTLFLVPASIYCIKLKKYFSALLVVVAMMAATSKTGVIIACFVVLIPIFFRSKIALFVFVAFCIFAFLISGDKIIDVIYALFTDEGTFLTRSGHFDSLIELFEENPLYLLFGQGAGTVFFTSGAGEYVNNIELDHLNSIRKFGIIWFFGFFVFVINVVWTNFSRKRASVAGALLLAFVVCGTNPVLLTLLFFSVLAFSYAAMCCDYAAL